jgi:hypothetical protein
MKAVCRMRSPAFQVMEKKPVDNKPNITEFQIHLEELVTLSEQLEGEEKKWAMDDTLKKLIKIETKTLKSLKSTKMIPVLKRKLKTVVK